MHKEIQFKLVGVSPLLMHSSRLANPLEPLQKEVKKLTSKRNKTEEDYREIARLQWRASLYVNVEGRIIIPSENIERMLIDASKKNKLSKQFSAGMFVDGDSILQYTGSNDIDKLWDDGKHWHYCAGVIQRNKVMVSRPIFSDWHLTTTVKYIASIINDEQIRDAMVTSGRIIGLCDWRPKYGRFEVE